MEGPERTILHVDMDAFFASVEVREDPSLEGRPVVVGADPDGGRGRGVVAAASYEAREYGIHSAMPISEAWRRCPHASFLRPRGGLYADVSSRIFEILGRYTDLVEPLSIDEAFLDVTGSTRLFGPGPRIAESIRSEVRREESLTASVGVASSKFVAKIASDLEKPDGFVVVPAGTEEEFLEPLDVDRLWGAGPRAQETFRELGASSIGDVARLGEERLVRAFGQAAGRRFHRLSRGIDERPVEPERERKSLGKERTFREDVSDRQKVEATLLDLSERVARRLREKGLAGATVTLKLRWEGFDTVTRQVTLDGRVDTVERIWPAARALLHQADRRDRKIRLVGVSVSGLHTAGESPARQLGLFEEPGARRTDARVAEAVDSLAERFGADTVTRAAVLRSGSRRSGPGGGSPIEGGRGAPGGRGPGDGRRTNTGEVDGDTTTDHENGRARAMDDGHVPSREEALELLHEYTESENLRKHMYAVEAAMRDYAVEYGEDADKWGVTGLLHDFDYERWPNEDRKADEEHPARGVEILREHGVSEEICRAIMAHAPYTGVPAESRMEKALRAVDDLTGFIVACALVRPNGIMDLKPKSVKKKLKDRSFAAAIDRDELRETCEELGEDFTEHIAFVTDSMRRIADTLELTGRS